MYSCEKTTADGRPLLIREAEGSDARAALAYLDQVSRETDFLTFGPGEVKRTLKEEVGALESCRDAENCLHLLADVEGRLAGMLRFQGGSRPRLRHVGEFGISVLKAYWGLGIAASLLDSLIEWAKNGKVIKKINLSVRVDNHRAIALYEWKGFVVEGRQTRAIFVDDVYYDNLWMGLQL